MVEVDGEVLTQERKVEIADHLFQRIDENIRASKNWSKDLILEISQRYENLAQENLSISQQKLIRLSSISVKSLRWSNKKLHRKTSSKEF